MCFDACIGFCQSHHCSGTWADFDGIQFFFFLNSKKDIGNNKSLSRYENFLKLFVLFSMTANKSSSLAEHPNLVPYGASEGDQTISSNQQTSGMTIRLYQYFPFYGAIYNYTMVCFQCFNCIFCCIFAFVLTDKHNFSYTSYYCYGGKQTEDTSLHLPRCIIFIVIVIRI